MTGPGLLDRLRWRLFWWLMTSLGLAQEKRRLQAIAQDSGASRSVAIRLSSSYFNTLRRGK